MVNEKTQLLEREYIIPLRKAWMNKARYKRTRASVIAVKKFIARHMKVADRDLDKVKIDSYLNNEMWFRGAKTPFSKIKVIAKKEGEIVRVELADMPEVTKFEKAKHEKRHKKGEKTIIPKREEKEEARTEAEIKEEKEKEKSVAVAGEKQMEAQAKAEKHTSRDRAPEVRRLALKK